MFCDCKINRPETTRIADKTQNIYEQQPSQNPGTVRIGRDRLRCDIVLSHPTVSGLHVEIFFDRQQQRFYIRNLRSQNPPVVDGSPLLQGEMPLTEGSSISLGQIKLNVTSISTGSIPATILLPPHPQPGVYGLECPLQRMVNYIA